MLKYLTENGTVQSALQGCGTRGYKPTEYSNGRFPATLIDVGHSGLLQGSKSAVFMRTIWGACENVDSWAPPLIWVTKAIVELRNLHF